ncbi:MAG: DEAD/DEAH box helicase family protein [Candidatus Margulisbacteria bacterium]|nr:DEAD/DEAH box helicase family protein [Candidatus Margulisiibacteriota bacterium]
MGGWGEVEGLSTSHESAWNTVETGYDQRLKQHQVKLNKFLDQNRYREALAYTARMPEELKKTFSPAIAALQKYLAAMSNGDIDAAKVLINDPKQFKLLKFFIDADKTKEKLNSFEFALILEIPSTPLANPLKVQGDARLVKIIPGNGAQANIAELQEYLSGTTTLEPSDAPSTRYLSVSNPHYNPGLLNPNDPNDATALAITSYTNQLLAAKFNATTTEDIGDSLLADRSNEKNEKLVIFWTKKEAKQLQRDYSSPRNQASASLLSLVKNSQLGLFILGHWPLQDGVKKINDPLFLKLTLDYLRSKGQDKAILSQVSAALLEGTQPLTPETLNRFLDMCRQPIDNEKLDLAGKAKYLLNNSTDTDIMKATFAANAGLQPSFSHQPPTVIFNKFTGKIISFDDRPVIAPTARRSTEIEYGRSTDALNLAQLASFKKTYQMQGGKLSSPVSADYLNGEDLASLAEEFGQETNPNITYLPSSDAKATTLLKTVLETPEMKDDHFLAGIYQKFLGLIKLTNEENTLLNGLLNKLDPKVKTSEKIKPILAKLAKNEMLTFADFDLLIAALGNVDLTEAQIAGLNGLRKGYSTLSTAETQTIYLYLSIIEKEAIASLLPTLNNDQRVTLEALLKPYAGTDLPIELLWLFLSAQEKLTPDINSKVQEYYTLFTLVNSLRFSNPSGISDQEKSAALAFAHTVGQKHLTFAELRAAAMKDRGVAAILHKIQEYKVGAMETTERFYEVAPTPETSGVPKPQAFQITKFKMAYAAERGLMRKYDKLRDGIAEQQQLIDQCLADLDKLKANQASVYNEAQAEEIKNLSSDLATIRAEQLVMVREYQNITFFLTGDSIPRDFYNWLVSKSVSAADGLLGGAASEFSQDILGLKYNEDGTIRNVQDVYRLLHEADRTLTDKLPSWSVAGFISLDNGSESGQELSPEAQAATRSVKNALSFFISSGAMLNKGKVGGKINLQTLATLEMVNSLLGGLPGRLGIIKRPTIHNEPAAQLKMFILSVFPMFISAGLVANSEINSYLNASAEEVDLMSITGTDLKLFKKYLELIPDSKAMLTDMEELEKHLIGDKLVIDFTSGAIIERLLLSLAAEHSTTVLDPEAAEISASTMPDSFHDFVRYNVPFAYAEVRSKIAANAHFDSLALLPEVARAYLAQQITLRVVMPFSIYVALPAQTLDTAYQTVRGKNSLQQLFWHSDSSIGKTAFGFFLFTNFAPVWYREADKKLEEGDITAALALFWVTNYVARMGGWDSVWGKTLTLDRFAWKLGLEHLPVFNKIPLEARAGALRYLNDKYHFPDNRATKIADFILHYGLDPIGYGEEHLNNTTTEESGKIQRGTKWTLNKFHRTLGKPYESLNILGRTLKRLAEYPRIIRPDHLNPHNPLPNNNTDLSLPEIEKRTGQEGNSATPVDPQVRETAREIARQSDELIKKYEHRPKDFWRDYHAQVGRPTEAATLRTWLRAALYFETGNKKMYEEQLQALDLFAGNNKVFVQMGTGQGKSTPALIGAGEEVLARHSANYILTTDNKLVTQLWEDPAINTLRKAGIQIYKIDQSTTPQQVADIYQRVGKSGGIIIMTYQEHASHLSSGAVDRRSIKPGVLWFEEVDWPLVENANTSFRMGMPGSFEQNEIIKWWQERGHRLAWETVQSLYQKLEKNPEKYYEKQADGSIAFSAEGQKLIRRAFGSYAGFSKKRLALIESQGGKMLQAVRLANEIKLAYAIESHPALKNRELAKGSEARLRELAKLRERYPLSFSKGKLTCISPTNDPETSKRFGGHIDNALRLVYQGASKIEPPSSTFADINIQQIMRYHLDGNGKIRGSSGTADLFTDLFTSAYPELAGLRVYPIDSFVPEIALSDETLNNRGNWEKLQDEIVRAATNREKNPGVSTRVKIVDESAQTEQGINSLRAEFLEQLNAKLSAVLKDQAKPGTVKLVEKTPPRIFLTADAETKYVAGKAIMTAQNGGLHIVTGNTSADIARVIQELKAQLAGTPGLKLSIKKYHGAEIISVRAGKKVLFEIVPITEAVINYDDVDALKQRVEANNKKGIGTILPNNRLYRGVDITVSALQEKPLEILANNERKTLAHISGEGANVDYLGGPRSIAHLVQSIGRVARSVFAGVKAYSLNLESFDNPFMQYLDQAIEKNGLSRTQFDEIMAAGAADRGYIELSPTSSEQNIQTIKKIIDTTYEMAYTDLKASITQNLASGNIVSGANKELAELVLASSLKPLEFARTFIEGDIRFLLRQAGINPEKPITSEQLGKLRLNLRQRLNANDLKKTVVEIDSLTGLNGRQAEKLLADTIYEEFTKPGGGYLRWLQNTNLQAKANILLMSHYSEAQNTQETLSEEKTGPEFEKDTLRLWQGKLSGLLQVLGEDVFYGKESSIIITPEQAATAAAPAPAESDFHARLEKILGQGNSSVNGSFTDVAESELAQVLEIVEKAKNNSNFRRLIINDKVHFGNGGAPALKALITELESIAGGNNQAITGIELTVDPDNKIKLKHIYSNEAGLVPLGKSKTCGPNGATAEEATVPTQALTEGLAKANLQTTVKTLAPIFGEPMAKEIAKELSTLDAKKIGQFEAELQSKIKQMSHREFADLMSESGISKEKANEIKTKLDTFQRSNMKVGFISIASGLLTMTAVSKLINKLSPDMNPALHFGLVMVGGHYSNQAVMSLGGKMIKDPTFRASIVKLAKSPLSLPAAARSAKTAAGAIKAGLTTAKAAPLATAGKGVRAAGTGIASGVKMIEGMGLGNISAASWKVLMDGMGVKNQSVIEYGSMGAFFVPDVTRIVGPWLSRVVGFKAFSNFAAKGAIGSAAKAVNVVGWVTFAADMTIGGIEHFVVKDPYMRSVIARAMEEWKKAQTSTFGKYGLSVSDALIGSFMDAKIPPKYLDLIQKQDKDAINTFMEELGKGVFQAMLAGKTNTEVKKMITDYLRSFASTKAGREYFENMQSLISLKYGAQIPADLKLLATLDLSDPAKISISEKLLNSLLRQTTFDGEKTLLQLNKARKTLASRANKPL